MESITSIKVCYKYADDWHVFTSDDLPGLYVAHQNAEVAYNDVTLSIKTLIRLSTGADCDIQPQVPFREFVTTIRKNLQQPERTRPTFAAHNQRYSVCACQ